MNNEEQPKALAVNEKISTAILLFLLLVRLVDQYLPVWIFGSNIPNWYAYWYVGIVYILTVAIIWLNRHRLADLNIDRPFVILLILGGFLDLFFLTPDIGILAAITAAFVFWAYRNNHFVLKNTVEYPAETAFLVSSSLLLAVLPVILFNGAFDKPFSFQAIIASALQAQLALAVVEEVIFRGALWAYLRHLGLKESTAFLLQAFLFWIAHSKYLFVEYPFSFWVTLPLASLLFGFMAWRSKSLTPGTIAHFLYNFTSVLIKKLL